MRLWGVCGLMVITAIAHAEPQTVRIGTIVPEGTSWAHVWRDFADDVERRTHGQVHIKTYYGGVTGDDLQSLSWVQHGKLDGIASPGMLCEQLAPSMRVLRLLGVYRDVDESRYVRERLLPTFDQEFRRSGFVDLGLSSVGAAILFSRVPMRTLADIKKARLWVWDIDTLGRVYADNVGIQAVRLPIDEVRAALETGKIDGVISVPSALVPYQWLPRLRYFADVPLAFLTACLVVDVHVFDRLTNDQQAALRAAAAQLSTQLEELLKKDNAKVLERARKQGLEEIVPSEATKAEVFEAYLKAREKVGDQLVPAELIRRAIAILQSYRAQRAQRP